MSSCILSAVSADILWDADIPWDVTYDFELRVVLDTAVLVAGLRSQLGAGNRVLLAVAERRLTPLESTYPLKLGGRAALRE